MSKKKVIIGYPILDLVKLVIFYLIFGFGIYYYDTTDIMYPIFIAFTALVAVVIPIKIFYGKRYISKNSVEAQQITKKNEAEFLKSLDEGLTGFGNFKFDDIGFKVISLESEEYVEWDKIDKLIAFKIDLLTFDEIRLQIHLESERIIEFGEEIPGWSEFVLRLRNQFVEIDSSWETNISKPAFERKETIIYKKLKS